MSKLGEYEKTYYVFLDIHTQYLEAKKVLTF